MSGSEGRSGLFGNDYDFVARSDKFNPAMQQVIDPRLSGESGWAVGGNRSKFDL